MEIHNMMEEMVVDTVEDIFSNKEYIEKAGCNETKVCKTDVICYVLNRIPPIYTTSSRGLAHVGNTFIDEPQSIADITALVNEGIKQVGAHHRPKSIPEKVQIPEPPMYNFPIIKGKVIDGKTFAPYCGSEISLMMSGELVSMNGPTWNNPSQLIDETAGGFLFWPQPVKADSLDEKRTFSLSIELNAPGFKPVKHFIKFDLKADTEFINSMEVNNIFKVEPIYLFGINEPEEIIPV